MQLGDVYLNLQIPYLHESLPTASASQDFPLQANLLSIPQAIWDLLNEFSDIVYSSGASIIITMSQCPPPHLNQPRPTCICQTPPSGPWETSLCPSKVFRHGESGYYSLSWFTLELSFAHGEEERWRMAPLRRLPQSKHRHFSWPPLSNISNFTSRISSSTVFSKQDLHKGYY